MISWTGLAPWELEFPFPGSLTSIFLGIEIKIIPLAMQVNPMLRTDDKGFVGFNTHTQFAPRASIYPTDGRNGCRRDLGHAHPVCTTRIYQFTRRTEWTRT